MINVADTPPPDRSIQDPRVKARIQQLRQTDDFTNLGYLAGVWLFLAAVIGATTWFFVAQAANGWSWWWNVPVTLAAIVLVGAGQHQLTGLAHDASHHILFKTRRWNDLASDLFCMFPIFSTTHHYRLQHIAHHQFTNDPERDPDVSQLQTSGHWLDFPLEKAAFVKTLLKQLWPPNLVRYMRIRARYNALGTDKNPYLKKGKNSPKLAILAGIGYLLSLAGVLTASVWSGNSWALGVAPFAMLAPILVFYALLPDRFYSASRVKPVITPRQMTLMRMTFLTLLLSSVAWLTHTTGKPVWMWFFLLWVVPIFTSFSFFMVLRQLVQHGNGDRGWLTNTRVFFVNPLIRWAVFPMGQDYHLPHHMYASIPHYRLPDLHELLLGTHEYRNEATVVEGYFLPPVQPPRNPTVLDVVGPEYATGSKEVHLDHSVLDGIEVENKEELLAMHGTSPRATKAAG
ncbi:MAG TPA: fatty acid desaturase [Planctomycetia bacterium]|nr:fatty acid desaturase [Planctomycetia bacterium]